MKKEDSKVASFFGDQKLSKEKVKTIKKRDDLTIIRGIGPVAMGVLNKNNINTFSDLANVKKDRLEEIIEVRGRYTINDWIVAAEKINKNEKRSKNNIQKSAIQIRKKETNKKINNKKIIKKNRIAKIKKNKKNKKTRILNIGNFFLIALFLESILFFTNQTFQGVNFEKIIFFYLIGMIVAIGGMIKLLLKRKMVLRKTPFDIFLFLFLLTYGISAYLSVDRWHSFVGFFNDPSRGFIFVAMMIVVFYLIVNNFSEKTAKTAWKVSVGGIVLLGWYTLLAGLGLIPLSVQVLIPFSLTGSVRGLTVVLAMGIPLLLMSMLLLKNCKLKKITLGGQLFLLLSLTSIFVDLMLLKSFVPWIPLALGLVVFGVLLVNRGGRKIGGQISRGTVFVVLGLFILLSGWARSDYHKLIPVLSKIGLPAEIHSSLPVSFGIVKNSLASDWKQILIGSGPATFGYDFAKFSPVGTISPSSEVQYLYQGEGMLSEGIPTIGIIGGVLLLILGVILIIKLSNAIMTTNESGLYSRGLFASLIIAMMVSVSDQMSGGVIIFIILMISLAVFFLVNNSEYDKKYYVVNFQKVTALKFAGSMVAILIMVALLSVGSYVIKSYLLDSNFKKALTTDDENYRKKYVEKITSVQLGEGVYYTQLGQLSLTTLGEKEKKPSEEEMEKTRTDVLKYVERGAQLMPNDVKTLKFLARVYEMIGMDNFNLTRKLNKKIVGLDPNSIQNYIKVGDTYLIEAKNDDNQEKLNDALIWYEKVTKINPRLNIAYDRIATVYYQKKDLQKAIDNLMVASKLDPKNMSRRFTLGVLYQLKGEQKDLATAEMIFVSLLKIAPNDIDVLAQLGSLYEQTNHIDIAKKEYEQIVSLTQGNEKLAKIKDVFEKFISNLNDGKLNINKNSAVEMANQNINNAEKESEDSNDENLSKDAMVVDNKNIDNKKNTEAMVIINVGDEGPINVRDKGSLAGKKITKITETGKFKKVGENENWIQIIIPGADEEKDLKAWVHSKFVK